MMWPRLRQGGMLMSYIMGNAVRECFWILTHTADKENITAAASLY